MLTFISYTGFPNYLALSTDIVENKISGVSSVGKVIFLTDLKTWKIVDVDLSLRDYNFNTFMTYNDMYALLMVGDEPKYAFVSSDEFHYKVHRDLLWSFSYLGTGIASSGTVNIGMSSGIKEVHMAIQFSATANGKVEIYYGDVLFSGGTSLSFQNHNYGIDTNPFSSLLLNPTIIGVGTIRDQLLIAGGTGGNSVGGTISFPFNREIRIPANTRMYMKYTNLDGNGAIMNLAGDMYEV